MGSGSPSHPQAITSPLSYTRITRSAEFTRKQLQHTSHHLATLIHPDHTVSRVHKETATTHKPSPRHSHTPGSHGQQSLQGNSYNTQAITSPLSYTRITRSAEFTRKQLQHTSHHLATLIHPDHTVSRVH